MPINTNLTDLTPSRDKYKKVIKLLSGGYSEPRAWTGGKLTVFPWDSTVDDFLMQESRKGGNNRLILYKLLEIVCDLNGGSVDNFVSAEVETVLLVSRAARYDSVLQYSSICPHCNTENTDRISVPDELEKVAEKPDGYKGFDTVTLPMSKDEVNLRPILIKDEKYIEERVVVDTTVSDHILRILTPIISVGGGKPDSVEELHRWFLALHPSDTKFLQDREEALTPHLNTSIPHVCDKCGRNYTHRLSFDQEFFPEGSDAIKRASLGADLQPSLGR